MKKLLRFVPAVSFVFATALHAQIDLTDDAYIDNFDDSLQGSSPHQTLIGELYGYYLGDGKPWLGDGWYYTFKDAGSSVINSAGEEVVTNDNETTMFEDGVLHVNLITSSSSEDSSFAGVGAALAGHGDGLYLDLSKATAITLRVKGHGSIRMHFETEDIVDMDVDWGWYGAQINLSSEWSEITVPVDQLLPEPDTEPFDAGMTWSDGSSAVRKFCFVANNGDDAELYIDYIKLDGMTWGDFNLFSSGVSYGNESRNINHVTFSNTAVSFKIDRRDDVSITLKNLRGETLHRLFSGRSAGHTVSFRNLNLANGRYLVTINGEHFRFSRPITYVK